MGNPAKVVVDGKAYNTVNINGQTWMAENLASVNGGWDYDDNVANTTIYGRLYNQADALSLIPDGWHLPDQSDWNLLFSTVNNSGYSLQTTDLWVPSNGTNQYGFNAVPAGQRNAGTYFTMGTSTYFRSSYESGVDSSYVVILFSTYDPLSLNSYSNDRGFSVRYVKDVYDPGSVAPTNITISNNSIIEVSSINSIIGSFSTTDIDIGDTFTYTLVSGIGSTDNNSFNISGSNLLNNITFNYNIKNIYSIRVRTTDDSNNYYEKQFTINILEYTPPVFTVLYDDVSFEKTEQVKLRESRQLIQSQTGMNGAILPAMYNKDLSYSYFVQLNDENTMVQNIYTLLLTRKGSRIMNPNYGIGIDSHIFELVEDPIQLESSILNEIDTAIKIYERRVTMIKEQSYILWDEAAHELKIIVCIRVPSGSVKHVGVTLSNIKLDV